jgi:5-methylcytosine-specific restriction endonuclease McrA
MYTKSKIPKAVREQVWLVHIGSKFQSKCEVAWCQNQVTVFDFQCGHNIPESRGGQTDIHNLRPICSRCNVSMGNQFSIDEWDKKFAPLCKKWWRCC